jgi:hypothetical protein
MEAIAEMDWWAVSGVFTPNDFRRMLDVEFISEIAVAFLHGLQNKKSSLDKWYATYEKEFPDRNRLLVVFQTVLGELSHLLPDMSATRWRKKSDFYSLFLVLANHVEKLPLTRSGRQQATRLLREFATSVDTYLGGDNKMPKNVIKYGDAVERAASDLANRRARAESLEVLLATVWA